MQLNTRSPWFPYNQAPYDEPARLFCFPYGGGNSVFYRQWQSQLPSHIKVYPVQLPGRGMRMQEPSFHDLPTLITDLAEEISPYLDRPFFLFGHSMGALVSFALTQYLQRTHQPIPAHLFVSGYHAPQLPDPNPPIHHLPEQDFIDEIAAMNGTPKELLENKEYLEVFLPSLRADFQLCETYQYQHTEPLQCPITAFGGEKDPEASPDLLQAWEEQTQDTFTLSILKGDHFFIHTAEKELIQQIRKQLVVPK